MRGLRQLPGVDIGAFAALLHQDLAHRFGRDLVFLDSESIGVGANWGDEILGRLRSCRVVLAVIGPGWLTALDPAGRRRIDDPADLTGAWTNRVTDTNSDLSQYTALALVESVENDRSSCPVTLYTEKDFQGYAVTLRPAEWANLAGTVWYHHIGSSRWC